MALPQALSNEPHIIVLPKTQSDSEEESASHSLPVPNWCKVLRGWDQNLKLRAARHLMPQHRYLS